MVLLLAALAGATELSDAIRALRDLPKEDWEARSEILLGLPRGPLVRALVEATPAALGALPDGVDPDEVVGRLAAEGVPVNRYIDALDTLPPSWRKALRPVQPAVVRIFAGKYGGTGVNLDPAGRVLTNAHVVNEGALVVEFPDGTRYTPAVLRVDTVRDLALLGLPDGVALPHAELAPEPPEAGQHIVIIGHPGRGSFPPFRVIEGRIEGFRVVRDGPQGTGATRHDAPTDWGHSGSPLFDADGHVLALHNSYDARTYARHAVSWEAMRAFLDGRPDQP